MGSWILGVTKMLFVVQATQSGLVGTIRDEESGEPIRGAMIVLPSLHRSVASDSAGRYVFREVPLGRHPVVIQRLGYFPRTLSALVPREGEVHIDIAMRAVPIRLPGMVVRAPVPLRGAEPDDSTGYPDREVSIAAVRAHPLLAEPDGFLGLGGGEIVFDPESPSGIHVRGGSSDQTAYLLDGVPVFSPYHSAGTFSAWNPDALERLKVTSASLSDGFPDALSGTVAAVTRTPGSTVRAQGGVSTTQARVVVDGPIGGAGYLVSFRTGFPGIIAPDHEASYLKGNTRDLMAKVEVPVGGGRVRALIYDGDNGIDGTAITGDTTSRPASNSFQWHSQSVGLQWVRSVGSGLVRVQAWTASGDADATWHLADTTALTVTADRRDAGVLAVVERSVRGATTSAGARVQWSRTLYRVAPLRGGQPSIDLDAQTPVAAIFLQHRSNLGRRLTAGFGGLGAVAAHQLYLNLESRLDWRLTEALLLSASYTRSHQFAQSLRNPESVVGNVFPADLYLGAGSSGVPVARSDRGVLAAEYRPAPGVRLGAQVYFSGSGGLLLVAPSTGEPFATSGFTIGSGRTPGFSLEAGWSRPRYGLLASYGWQQVQLRYADSAYTPVHGARHQIEVGATAVPWTNSSIRIGATGVFGRRSTAVAGGFEWEACNLLDKGCEFSGSPRTTEALGGTRLPAYLRLDLSLRREWNLSVGPRAVTMGLFATMTNVLGRHNLLTVATDPASGRRSPIEMRPFAPLVAGLDWRF
jgi:carboxypeptidase family protein/TonB-dependent receptor-like protein